MSQERTLSKGLMVPGVTHIGPAEAQLLSARMDPSLHIAPVPLILLRLTLLWPWQLADGWHQGEGCWD